MENNDRSGISIPPSPSHINNNKQVSEQSDIQKGVQKSYTLSLHLFNIYAKHIMKNVRDNPKHETFDLTS